MVEKLAPALATCLALTLCSCTVPVRERDGWPASWDALRDVALAGQDLDLAFAGFSQAAADTPLAAGEVKLQAPELPLRYQAGYSLVPASIPNVALAGPETLLAREQAWQQGETELAAPVIDVPAGARIEQRTTIERSALSRLSLQSEKTQVWLRPGGLDLSAEWESPDLFAAPAACTFSTQARVPVSGGSLILARRECANPPSPLFARPSQERHWVGRWQPEADAGRNRLNVARFAATTSRSDVQGYALGLERQQNLGPLDTRWVLGGRDVEAPGSALDGAHWTAQADVTGQFHRLDLTARAARAGGEAPSPLRPAAASRQTWELHVGADRLFSRWLSHPGIHSGLRLAWWNLEGEAPTDGAVQWDFSLRW